jgi:hypothetical protein
VLPIRAGLPEPATASPITRRCPHDGAELEASGFCARGGGFPLGQPCRFACPICGGALDWSGGCDRCHGAASGHREDWSFPGDRYDCYDDKGKPIGDGVHWVKTDGPRRACSPEENRENAALLRRTLGKFGDMPDDEIPF